MDRDIQELIRLRRDADARDAAWAKRLEKTAAIRAAAKGVAVPGTTPNATEEVAEPAASSGELEAAAVEAGVQPEVVEVEPNVVDHTGGATEEEVVAAAPAELVEEAAAAEEAAVAEDGEVTAEEEAAADVVDEDLTVEELKGLLRDQGKHVGGNKEDLLKRLHGEIE